MCGACVKSERERRRRLWGIDFEASLHISASASTLSHLVYLPHFVHVRTPICTFACWKGARCQGKFLHGGREIKWRAPPPPVHIPLLNECVCVCLHLCSALISRHSTQKEGRFCGRGWKIQQLWVVFPALCVTCIARTGQTWNELTSSLFHRATWKLSCNQRKQLSTFAHAPTKRKECLYFEGLRGWRR
jgi:hypothetical protein